MTTVDAQSLTDFLAETPARVRSLVADLSDDDTRWKYAPQEFSALEHICHLCDLEREGYAARIEKLLHEEQPFLPDFDGSRIAAERDYNNQQSAIMLDAFAEARASNVRAARNLTAEHLARSGTLERVGRITLGEVLLKMREHDEAHLQELNILREQLRQRKGTI